MNKMSSKDKDGNNYRNNSTRYENKRDYYENGNNSYYHYSNSSSTTNGSYNESSNPPSNSHPKYYKSYDGTYKKVCYSTCCSMSSHDSMIKHECNESLVLSLLVV